MKYRAQVNEVEPSGWLNLEAKTMEDAAIEALRATKPMPELPCTVYVADPRPDLVQDNGQPMLVHGYKIERTNPKGKD